MKLIRSDNTGVEFVAVPFFGDGDGKSRFHIPWHQINHKGKLLRWIRHLSESGWFTPHMCAELIDHVARYFGWTVEGTPK